MDSTKAIKQLKKLDKLAPTEMRLAAEWKKDWQVLIATILSAQTKDETTIAVCDILFAKYPTAEKLGAARLNSIEKIIRRVNYHKTKARHIKESARIISRGGIPEDLEGLLKLPGVGRKVGNVYLAEARKEDAIGVDTHVGRISLKLSWTDSKNPHKVEKDLMALFPKKYWRSINYILVRFGRSIGRSRKKEDEVLALC
jgi:endonuclease III